MKLSNRSNAQGEWPAVLDNGTVYKVDETLYTGHWVVRGVDKYIELTPLTEAQRSELARKGILKGLEDYK